jgi:methanogenic corrinoid protein MtbC1
LRVKNEIVTEIANNIGTLEDRQKLKKLVSEALSQGIPIEELVEKGIRKGLDIVGKKYNDGEYFLAELMFSGTMVSEAMEILKPYLEKAGTKKKGIMVIGSVAGDIHDIGKNLIKMLLTCRGWEVQDIGVDIPPEKFVEAVKKFKPDVVGMSSLLTTTAPMYGVTTNELKKANLRSGLKIIIGGNAASKEIADEIGADGYATSAQEGIDQVESWIKK